MFCLVYHMHHYPSLYTKLWRPTLKNKPTHLCEWSCCKWCFSLVNTLTYIYCSTCGYVKQEASRSNVAQERYVLHNKWNTKPTLYDLPKSVDTQIHLIWMVQKDICSYFEHYHFTAIFLKGIQNSYPCQSWNVTNEVILICDQIIS